MTTENYGLIELGLVFGGLLAFLLWELWTLRRDKRRRDAARKDQKPPTAR